LFAELGVSTRAAEMSMSVRCAGCGLHYAGQRGPGGLAAGLRRGGGRFLRLLADVPRFHRAGRRLLAGDSLGDGAGGTLGDARGDPTFGEFLNDGGFSAYFQAHFALPLVAAVWSCPAGTAVRYPARYLFAFLANHGMLSVSGSPPWRTVTGGSRCYVERAARRLACVRLGTPVRASWNYELGHCQAHSGQAVRISYHMNRLQGLAAGQDYIVTLNGQGAVDPGQVISQLDYAHPAYTPQSVAAQRRLPELNTPVTAFAGAYHGWGFHEDGCRSGAEAARALGRAW
jgi:predicted NAD/FAD-binding protein